MDELTKAYLTVISEEYTIRHPFSFTAKAQREDEVLDKIKAGEECDGVVCRIETIQRRIDLIHGDEFDGEIDTGTIECPRNLKGREHEILMKIADAFKSKEARFRIIDDSSNKWKFTCGPNVAVNIDDVKSIQLGDKTITVVWRTSKNVQRFNYNELDEIKKNDPHFNDPSYNPHYWNPKNPVRHMMP